ncbi:UNVERIFIED_CONTAM: GDSL esterase/lipase [Sesamum angustifolium]|uniref:GDSL esterase/lipase n=1 Tax=Sesamum angustifolium TaxID=2727405 RepID=A0AAW2QD33_9LAMI
MANIHISPFLCLFFILVNVIPHSADETQPTIFILGDSTADVGTNTYLPGSKVRANFSQYGIDFPHSRPTGRFSNGFNSADFVARFFGLKRSPPPFLFLLTLKSNHFQKHLLKGVNFASAGSGLLDITGPYMYNARDLFIGILISAYSNHITNLYRLGARKFGIISVPPVGCCPSQRLLQKLINGVDGCFPPQNDFALAFHSALDTLLVNISSQLPGFKYSLGNGYLMTMDVINNPRASGFDNVDSACCGYGILNSEGPCNSTASLCPDRRKYLFWDQFHPTKRAAFLAAQTLYNGPPYYVSPINFSQLAKDY